MPDPENPNEPSNPQEPKPNKTAEDLLTEAQYTSIISHLQRVAVSFQRLLGVLQNRKEILTKIEWDLMLFPDTPPSEQENTLQPTKEQMDQLVTEAWTNWTNVKETYPWVLTTEPPKNEAEERLLARSLDEKSELHASVQNVQQLISDAQQLMQNNAVIQASITRLQKRT